MATFWPTFRRADERVGGPGYAMRYKALIGALTIHRWRMVALTSVLPADGQPINRDFAGGGCKGRDRAGRGSVCRRQI